MLTTGETDKRSMDISGNKGIPHTGVSRCFHKTGYAIDWSRIEWMVARTQYLVHAENNVWSSNELPLDEYLRECWPVAAKKQIEDQMKQTTGFTVNNLTKLVAKLIFGSNSNSICKCFDIARLNTENWELYKWSQKFTALTQTFSMKFEYLTEEEQIRGNGKLDDTT